MMVLGEIMIKVIKTPIPFQVHKSFFRGLGERIRKKRELKAAFRRNPRPARVKIDDPDKPFVRKARKGWL
jgi:hypothetical protein